MAFCSMCCFGLSLYTFVLCYCELKNRLYAKIARAFLIFVLIIMAACRLLKQSCYENEILVTLNYNLRMVLMQKYGHFSPVFLK